jgi:hypothetical protein
VIGARRAGAKATIMGIVTQDGRPTPPDAVQYVGMTFEAAVAAVRRDGIVDIRVLESVDGMIVTRHHLDRRLDRLNLIVEHGLVCRAPFY